MVNKEGLKNVFYLRLREFYKSLGYKNDRAFSVNALGYNGSEKINRLKKDGNKPSIDILKDISNKFENFNLHWYITGKGEMLLSDNENCSSAPPSSSELTLESLDLEIKRKDFEIKGLVIELTELKEEVEDLKKFALNVLKEEVKKELAKPIKVPLSDVKKSKS